MGVERPSQEPERVGRGAASRCRGSRARRTGGRRRATISARPIGVPGSCRSIWAIPPLRKQTPSQTNESFGNRSQISCAHARRPRDPRSRSGSPDILDALRGVPTRGPIALDFSTPLECVVATILSAQSTDAKINEVTMDLFVKYRTPEDYLGVPDEELQNDLRPTGFFNQKTKSVKGMASKLLEDFDGRGAGDDGRADHPAGRRPEDGQHRAGELLPGGRQEGPRRRHRGRYTRRAGRGRAGADQANSKDAAKIEQDLMQVVPKAKWGEVTDPFIMHGRTICDAKKPRLRGLCRSSHCVLRARRPASPISTGCRRPSSAEDNGQEEVEEQRPLRSLRSRETSWSPCRDCGGARTART